MKIISSAIKKDGVIYTGRRHINIIEKYPEVFGTDHAKYMKGVIEGNYKEGFITDNLKFLTRKEAAVFAYKYGQVNELLATLYSENLW